MPRCAWHECNREFEPTDFRQEFCAPECRKARGAWKARRGGPLVDMLLNGNADALMEQRLRIKKEIEDATTRNN